MAGVAMPVGSLQNNFTCEQILALRTLKKRGMNLNDLNEVLLRYYARLQPAGEKRDERRRYHQAYSIYVPDFWPGKIGEEYD